MNEERQRLEKELYELAQCVPLNDEQLVKFTALQKRYRRLLKRQFPIKQKIEFRFRDDTEEVEFNDAIEPEICLNPLKEGYILKRVVEIIEYHKNKPNVFDVYYINEDKALKEPKIESDA